MSLDWKNIAKIIILRKAIYRFNAISVKLQLDTSRGEQDGRGVGGCGEHISPWIHQDYTFRHRSTCRTQLTAESR